jgi:selenocysteine lyase/cysteine desulfurase
LRVPPGCALRPVYTGWFAGFDELEAARTSGRRVSYGAVGATRFAGSTFDPTSTFRARAVARFFDAHGMTVDALRATSLAQTSRILAAAQTIERARVATPTADADRAGFVALRTGADRAAAIVRALRAENVYADARGDLLRLGPAPYVTDAEIDRGMALVARALTA